MAPKKDIPKRKRTFRQNLALAGVVLLLAMYVVTFISAFMKSEAAQTLFRASIACTILVPVFLWAFLMAAKAVRPDKSPVIDSVVLDVGNVLISFPWMTFVREQGFSEGFLRCIMGDIRSGEIWNEFDRGVKSFDEVKTMYYEAFPDFKDEIDRFLDIVDQCMELYPYTESFVGELNRRGYKVYILSNWSDFLYKREETKGHMAFTEYVDGAFWSYRHHLLKPDPAYFEKLIDTYDIDPKRAVYIDDMQKNIDAAASLGFCVIKFSDYQDMRTKLAGLGVKV